MWGLPKLHRPMGFVSIANGVRVQILSLFVTSHPTKIDFSRIPNRAETILMSKVGKVEIFISNYFSGFFQLFLAPIGAGRRREAPRNWWSGGNRDGLSRNVEKLGKPENYSNKNFQLFQQLEILKSWGKVWLVERVEPRDLGGARHGDAVAFPAAGGEGRAAFRQNLI